MDRKAWFVITLCAVGMAVNYWFAVQNQQALAAQQAAAPKPAAVAPATAAETAAATPAANAAPAAASEAAPEERHVIEKGSVAWHFTTRGGGVEKAVLGGSDQITLNGHGKEPVGALRREAAGLDAVAYRITEKSANGVTFEGVTADGIAVRKAYVFGTDKTADPHLVRLTVTLTNTGAAAHRSEEYHLFAGTAASMAPDEPLRPSVFWNDAGDADHKDANWFGGGMFSNEKTEYRASHARLRYAGVMSRFYATIVSREGRPEKAGKIWASRFLVDHSNDKYKDEEAGRTDWAMQAAISLPPVELAPGASQAEEYEIYMGPKEYHRLKELGGQREFIMFYGMFGLISKGLTNVMRWMHDLSGNWGIAIILLTIVIRTLLWPLQSKAQYSMKRMALLAPKMKELQEKFKDEPQKQQMEVMKLYKDYGVNPLGGCLPMLLQIPIFFAFYSVLQNAAELRGQPFLWVKDLSIADTVHTLVFPFHLPLMGNDFDINPLPLIMGLTMILQMKLTPQPATVDKTQKMMFAIMPFFFLFICYNFAAALSLYWSTQNVYAIFQSWIMRMYMKDPVLEKVERLPKGPPPQNPFFNPMNPGNKDKKKGHKPPKLGG